jgi:AcrR family transcriptional regulator
MPPKNKVDKEQIIEAAFKITREEGFGAITTRKLANALKCSTQPIYYAFKNMEDLKQEVYVKAREFFENEVLKRKNSKDIEFLAIGVSYIMTAKVERNVFRFISMENNYSLQGVEELVKGVNLPSKESYLFLNMWIYAHGIATIVANNDVVVSEENIRELLLKASQGFEKAYG